MNTKQVSFDQVSKLDRRRYTSRRDSAPWHGPQAFNLPTAHFLPTRKAILGNTPPPSPLATPL